MQKPTSLAVALLSILAGFLATLPLSAQTTITLVDSPLYYTDTHTTTVANPLTFTIADGIATQIGVIDGAGSLTKTGAGFLSLAGANIYSGGTIVDVGILAIDHDGEFTFGTLGSGTTTINGDSGSGLSGSLQFLTNSSAASATFIIGGSTIDGGSGGALEFYGASTADSGTFTANGATASGTSGGFMFFLGASTAGSATLIANDSANVGAGGSIYFMEDSLGGTATVQVYGNGLLDLGYHNGSLTIGSLEGTGQVFLGANNLTIGSNHADTTFSGVVQDGGAAGGALGSLTKTGTGTLTLSGANTYTGGTAISGGQVTMGHAGALGTGSVDVASGATLDASSYGFDLNRLSGAGTLTSSGAYTASPASDVTLATNLAGTASLTKEGSATLTLTGTNTYTGGTTLSNGTLQIGNGGTTGSIVGDVLDNGSLTFNRSNTTTYAGVISGSGSVAQSGTGTLTLTGTNTYAGGTSVTNYGAIEFSSGANLGTGNITLDGGVLKWATGNTTDISSRLNPFNYNGAIFDTNGNNVSFASSLSGEDNSWFAKTGPGTLTLSGVTGTYMTFAVTGGTLDFGTGAYQGNLDIGGTAYSANPQSDSPTAAIISGTGTSFTSDGSTSVGNANGLSASLTISGGASFNAGYGTSVGSYSTGESTLTVTGAGTTFTGSTLIGVGGLGSGRSTFSVSDGASVTTQYTHLGNTSTGESLLTVSGTGSTFTSTGGLTIGLWPGSGQLSTDTSSMIVSDGASASAGPTVIGLYGSLGANSLTITGAGSKFTNTGTLTLADGAADNGTLNLGSAAGAAATAAGILDTATVTGGLGAAVLQFNTTGTDLAPTTFTRDGTNTGTGVNTTGGLSIINTAGTTVLSGTGTHTGATIINGGTLVATQLANGGASSSIGQSTNAATNLVLNGGALRYTGGAQSTDRLFQVGDTTAGAIGTLDASGTGALAFTNTGSVAYGTANQTRTLALTGTNTGANTLAALIADNGGAAVSLAKSGAGSWLLTGTNTYSGGTTITSGQLTLGNAAALGTGPVSVASGATLDAASYGFDLNRLSGAGTITSSGTYTASSASVVTLATNLTGTASLTQTGAGTLTLTGTNTYSGGTTVGAATAYTYGMIEFSSGANLGTGNITLDGGGLKWAAGNTADISSRLNPISYNGSILDTNGNNVSFASVLSGDTLYNYSQLIKTGAGTLTLAAGSTVVDFQVLGGTLVFGPGNYQDRYLYVGNGGWATSVNGAVSSAAILSGAGTSFSSQETNIGSYTAFSAALTISDGASFASTGGTTIGDHSTAESTLTVTGTGSTFTGDIGLSVGYFSSARSSFLVSDGASATLQFSTSIGYRSTGESLLTVSGAGSTFTADSPLTIGVGEYPGSAPFVTGASSMIVSGGAAASAVTTSIGRLGATGANSLTLTGTGSTFTTGSLTLAVSAFDNGTLNLGSAAGDVATAAGILDAATITGGLGAATLQFNTTGTALAPTYFTRDGTSTGAGVNTTGGLSLVNTAGTTVLSGTGTHTGATIINGGTLVASQLANGGSSSNIGQSTNAAANLILNGGALRYTGGAQSTDRLFQIGDTTAGATGTLDASGTGALAFTNTGSLAYGTDNQIRTLGLTGTNTGANTLATLIADNGTGAVSVAKSGAGSWTLTGTNTYTGGTILEQGTLTAGNAASFGSGTVRINGGTLNLGGLTLGNALDVRGGTLTGLAGYTGTQTISTAMHYSGTVGGAVVVASGGSLDTTGATFTGATTVLSGGRLGGTGLIDGLVTLQGGSHLAPGNSPGTITFSEGLTLTSGSFLDFELGTTSDKIVINDGILTGPAGTHGIAINLINSGGFIAGATYVLIDFTGADSVVNFEATDFTVGDSLAGFNSYNFALVGSTLTLTASAIPEPSTYAALAGLIALGLAVLRRRRSA